MGIHVTLPQLGESVVEGTVARWLVHEGDLVARDQAIVEVETDKATVEVPAPEGGRVAKIVAGEGTTVAVGAVLCEIGEVAVASTTPSVVITPVVRRLAEEHGVDLNQVKGTGAGGRVTKDDVLGCVEERRTRTRAGTGAQEEILPWSRRRKLIAEHMVASKQIAPHVACVAEVDMERVARMRKENPTAKFNYTAAVAVATARTLVEPECRFMNAIVRGETTVVHRSVHLGIAVDAEEGLLVPVIRNADCLGLVAVARVIEDLAERARARKILPDELQGGTFTISNPGPRGNLYGTAILNQPQVGILRMGEIVKRPVVVTENGEDRIAIRPMMYLCLSYDHRVIDGRLGNHFLRRVRERLETSDLPLEG